jgi:hypothetical protein
VHGLESHTQLACLHADRCDCCHPVCSALAAAAAAVAAAAGASASQGSALAQALAREATRTAQALQLLALAESQSGRCCCVAACWLGVQVLLQALHGAHGDVSRTAYETRCHGEGHMDAALGAAAADAVAADTAAAAAQLAQVQSDCLSTTLPADAVAVQEVAEPAVDGAEAAAGADDVALAPAEYVSLLHAAAAAAAAEHAVEAGVAKHAAEAAIANGQVAAAAGRLEVEVALQVPGVCMHTVIAAVAAVAAVVRAAAAAVDIAEDGVAHIADEPDTADGRLAVAERVEAEALLSSPCCYRERRGTDV